MQKALQIISLTMVPVCGYLSHHLHHYVVDASLNIYIPLRPQLSEKTRLLPYHQKNKHTPRRKTSISTLEIHFTCTLKNIMTNKVLSALIFI